MMMICIDHKVISQDHKTSLFYEPIPLELGWTEIQLPNHVREPYLLNISIGLEVKQDSSKHIWVRPTDTSKRIFYVDIDTKDNPVSLMFFASANENNKATKTSMVNDSSQIILEKYVDRRFYISVDPRSEELFILWNNTILPYRKTGRTLVVSLPKYADKIDSSYLRVYTAIPNQTIQEFLLPLEFGKPGKNILNALGLDWNMINQQKIDLFSNEDIMNLHAIQNNDVDSTQDILPKWLGIYCDIYYARYTDSVGNNTYQQFPGISPRNNAIGLNTLQINVQYALQKLRGTFVFHIGDYAKTTWSNTFNQVMEANIGIRLHKLLWMDAGFFRSYIGTEGLLPRENICSSESIYAWHEPSHVSGVRLNYTPTNKLTLNIYLLNAYNGFEDFNEKKSVGFACNYIINEKGSVGYTNYLGDDTVKDSMSISHLRFYQNIYFNYQLKKLKLQIGADYAIQQHADLKNVSRRASLFSGVASAYYAIHSKFGAYGRLEYFNDPNAILSAQIMDTNGQLTGYSVWGITAGLEFRPYNKSYVRLEGRRLEMDADQQIFRWNGKYRNVRTELMLHMGVSF
jgi:hypothetical protein